MRELHVELRIKSWTEAKEERVGLYSQWEQLYEKNLGKILKETDFRSAVCILR